MSPHAFILLAALLTAGIGKLVFPGATLRIIAGVVIGLQVVLIIALGEVPSLLGLAIMVPISAIGAGIGVAGARWVARRLQLVGTRS